MKKSFFQITLAIVIVTGYFLSVSPMALAETFYKYTNEQGTIVFTQNLSEVPLHQREVVQTIKLKDKIKQNAAEQLKQVGRSDLKEMLSKKKVTAFGKEKARQGRALFISFFRDESALILAYAAGGIATFLLLSKLLKRFAGGFAMMLVMKLAIVVVLFGGVYLFYLSWLNNSVLNFNQPGALNKSITEQITTPQEILEKTQAAVEQFNQASKKQKTLLNEIDGN